jgi:hypothetical protein
MEKVGFGRTGMEWLGMVEVSFVLFHKFVSNVVQILSQYVTLFQFEKKDRNKVSW